MGGNSSYHQILPAFMSKDKLRARQDLEFISFTISKINPL